MSRFNTTKPTGTTNLAGYGTLQMPENDVFLLAGFSDKIFDLMSYLETDKKAIFKAIDEISLK